MILSVQIAEVWKLCLQMWDDIFDLPGDIHENKETWMIENDFEKVMNACFFCQFAHDEYFKPENHGSMCDFCPGVLVDPKFNCVEVEYDYRRHPKEFRRRLHQLNKKRVGK